jgi:hypothetical protein
MQYSEFQPHLGGWAHRAWYVGGERIKVDGKYLDSPNTRLVPRLPNSQQEKCAEMAVTSPTTLTCTLPALIGRFPRSGRAHYRHRRQ